MEVERLEEGFDLTTSSSATGHFHSGRGLGVSCCFLLLFTNSNPIS